MNRHQKDWQEAPPRNVLMVPLHALRHPAFTCMTAAGHVQIT